MLSVSRPTPLRLAGFVLSAAGGLLVALGSLLPWVTVGLREDAVGALDSRIPGTDLLDGKMTLALGVGLLIGIVALRAASAPAAKRAIAVAMLVAGLAATAIGLAGVARAEDRSRSPGVEALAEDLAGLIGVSEADARRQLEAAAGGLVEVRVEPAPWLVAAGGLLAAGGAVLGLLWARGRRIAEPPAELG